MKGETNRLRAELEELASGGKQWLAGWKSLTFREKWRIRVAIHHRYGLDPRGAAFALGLMRTRSWRRALSWTFWWFWDFIYIGRSHIAEAKRVQQEVLRKAGIDPD